MQAMDGAKGVLYLHRFEPPLIHRDLKSPNLLVDGGWRVKVLQQAWEAWPSLEQKLEALAYCVSVRWLRAVGTTCTAIPVGLCLSQGGWGGTPEP